MPLLKFQWKIREINSLVTVLFRTERKQQGHKGGPALMRRASAGPSEARIRRELERFQDKWTRLSGSKTRPNKDLEPGFGSTKTEKALNKGVRFR